MMRGKQLILGGCLAVLGFAGGAHPAEARLQPRLDLPEGFNFGFQPNNLSVDYRLGAVTAGVNALVMSDSPTPYIDPAFRVGVAAFENPYLIVGWMVGAESNSSPVGRQFNPDGPGYTIVPAKPHQWSWETGLMFSIFHEVAVGSNALKFHFDPTVSLTVANDGSVTMGRSWGYDMGIQVNRAFDILLQNVPLLQTTVVGIRAHL